MPIGYTRRLGEFPPGLESSLSRRLLGVCLLLHPMYGGCLVVLSKLWYGGRCTYIY